MQVFKYEGHGDSWVKPQSGIAVQLPKDTLVYAELAEEIHDPENRNKSRRTAFHIIDGIVLGGMEIWQKCFKER
jgi:hypothetical protein